MIWIDSEVVFARLNTLLTVAKEATDRVIETALRADTFSGVQADPESLPPYNAEGQPETHQESVKQSDIQRTRQNSPLPLPTRDGSLVPARRVHVRGEDPQPVVKEAVPQRTEMRPSVGVKKIEIQSPSALHPGRQDLRCNYGLEEPLPSPTMPPLEDAEARFEYHEIGKYGQS